MINADEIRKTVEQKLEGTDKFIVEIKVKAGNNITILLDSDTNLSEAVCPVCNEKFECVCGGDCDCCEEKDEDK